jgi:hypothetical protein
MQNNHQPSSHQTNDSAQSTAPQSQPVHQTSRPSALAYQNRRLPQGSDTAIAQAYYPYILFISINVPILPSTMLLSGNILNQYNFTPVDNHISREVVQFITQLNQLTPSEQQARLQAHQKNQQLERDIQQASGDIQRLNNELKHEHDVNSRLQQRIHDTTQEYQQLQRETQTQQLSQRHRQTQHNQHDTRRRQSTSQNERQSTTHVQPRTHHGRRPRRFDMRHYRPYRRHTQIYQPNRFRASFFNTYNPQTQASNARNYRPAEQPPQRYRPYTHRNPSDYAPQPHQLRSHWRPVPTPTPYNSLR